MADIFTISGRKIQDNDGDGDIFEDVTFLGGWTIFIDDNDNGVFDAGERSTVTAIGTGLWSFTELTSADAGKRVYEVAQSGWTQTVGTTGYVIVDAGPGGEQTGLDFGNFENFTISGRKVQDTDGDGDIAEDTTLLGGFTIFVDDDGDGVLDAGERSTVSADGTGAWSIAGLTPDDAGKRVYEVTQDGWTQTVGAGGFVIANPGSGGVQNGIDFGNFQNFTISGEKFQDDDGDGNIAEDGIILDGFTIFIDDDGDGVFDPGERSTVSTGRWSISGLTPDDVGKRVYEVALDGWTQTVGMDGFVIVNPGSGGEQSGLNFGNFENFTISGVKLLDEDGDGNIAEDGTLLDGFTIFIDDDGDGIFDAGERSTLTSSEGSGFGSWSIAGLTPDDVGKRVYEATPDGWTTTVGADGFLITNPGSGGELSGLNFGNFENFTISGYKLEDEDGDGNVSEDGTLLDGITIFIDDDGDGVFDPGERSTVTTFDEGGFSWSLEATPADAGKRVHEAAPDGWTVTAGADGFLIVNPGSGGEQTRLDFGNFQNFTISGRKALDINGDGGSASGTFLGGFTMFVDDDGDGVFDAGERSAVSADLTRLWSIGGLTPDDVGKRVYEATPDGWTTTFGMDGYVIVNPGSGGEQANLDFNNFENFTISGRKIQDDDGDGNITEDATFLGGFTIFVDDDGDGALDAGERSTVSADGTGLWSITNLAPEDAGKRVYEVAPSGWTQTVGIDGLVIVNPGSGGEQTGLDFGNFENFTISGRKVLDADGDGDISEDATFLGGWTIFIDDDSDGVLDSGERFTVTSSDPSGFGSWSITGLTPDDAGKRVREVAQTDWAATVGMDGFLIVNPGSGGTQSGLDFGNVFGFTISGRKVQDNDGDGDIAEDVTFLGGFTIFIDDDGDGVFDTGERFTVTSSDPAGFGSWSLTELTSADAGKRVYEVAQSGWTQTVGTGGYLIVDPGPGGEQTDLDFGNFENFTISGRKVLDADGDGDISEDATFLGGWTIFIDDDGDGVLDAGERSTVTSSDAPDFGSWSITGLTPDDAGKRVREVAQTDWAATVGGDGFLIVNPGSGGTQSGLDFGNVFGFTISGRKVQDDDGDGDIAEDVTFLGGWTIFIDDDGDGVLDAGERSTATSSDSPGFGNWSFTELTSADAGKRVYEVAQGGWTQTVGTGGYLIVDPGPGGEQTGLDFGNFENFTISGLKVLDADGDGDISEDATFLGGWTIFVDDDDDGVLDSGERFTVTSSDPSGFGSWSITGLTPDDAGKRVREVAQDGWIPTVGIDGFEIINPGSGGTQSGLDLGNTDRNDAPVFRGGDSAIYFVRVNSADITTLIATDADSSEITYSIVGGSDPSRFTIDASTGELAFEKHAAPAHKSYVLEVEAAHDTGGTDRQTITVNVVSNKMQGDAAQSVAETFVFHPKFGANSISNFDVEQDVLQFDSGMFAADTAAAVLDRAHEHHDDVIIQTDAGRVEIKNVTLAELGAHPEGFMFV
jgi:hypothetical protein